MTKNIMQRACAQIATTNTGVQKSHGFVHTQNFMHADYARTATSINIIK